MRILVIDDSLSSLLAIEMILAEAGCEVRTCSDGRRALEMLKSEPFDLVITDIFMPDMDGLELIQEEHQIRPDIPIVAVSGMTGPRSMLKVAQHLGACQTVQKPFSKANLLAAIEAAVGTPLPGPGSPPGEIPVTGGSQARSGPPALAPGENRAVYTRHTRPEPGLQE